MNARTATFYICIIGMIGGSAAAVNSIFPNNSTALVGVIIMTACMSLFFALLSEVMTANIVNAVLNKERAEQVSLLSSVIGHEVYKVIEEEKAKEKV